MDKAFSKIIHRDLEFRSHHQGKALNFLKDPSGRIRSACEWPIGLGWLGHLYNLSLSLFPKRGLFVCLFPRG